MGDPLFSRAEDRRLFGLAVTEPEAPTEVEPQV